MIYILLPVHNRRMVTRNFVCALLQQTVKHFRLVLIDDGSIDGTAATVQALLQDRVTVLRGAGNWWWAGALDAGWHWRLSHPPDDEDVICICNDDVEFDENFLANGAKLLLPHRTLLWSLWSATAPLERFQRAVLQSIIDAATSCSQIGRPHRLCADPRPVYSLEGHAQGWRFSSALLPHYLSDLEWTLRAQRKGSDCPRPAPVACTRPRKHRAAQPCRLAVNEASRPHFFKQICRQPAALEHFHHPVFPGPALADCPVQDCPTHSRQPANRQSSDCPTSVIALTDVANVLRRDQG